MSYLRFRFGQLCRTVENFFVQNICRDGGNVVILYAKGEHKTMNDSKLPKIAYIYIDESGTPTLEIEKNGVMPFEVYSAVIIEDSNMPITPHRV